MVTICPPALEPRPGESFDVWQFAKRRPAVSIESRISFGDYYRGMSVENHGDMRRTQQFAPTFMNNPEQARKVLAYAAWRYVYGSRKLFNENVTLDELRPLVAAKQKKWQVGSRRKKYRALRKNLAEIHVAANGIHGWLPRHAAIMYYSWKCRWPAPDIASKLGISSYAVRIALYRIIAAAEALGYPTFRHGQERERENARRKKKREERLARLAEIAAKKQARIQQCQEQRQERLARIQQLVDQGLSWPKIEKLEGTKQRGNRRMNNAHAFYYFHMRGKRAK